MSTEPKTDLDFWPAGALQPELLFNALLLYVAVWTQATVDSIETAPPGSPSDGAMVLVDTGATGDFAGHEGDVAYYSDEAAAWIFFAPAEGYRLRDLSSDLEYRYVLESPPAWVEDSGAGIQFQEAGVDVGTSGQFSTVNFTSGASLTDAGGGVLEVGVSGGPPASDGGGGRILVGRVVVTGAAVGSMQITGLDLTADGDYFFRAKVKNATGSSMYCYLEMNGDTTLTNYYCSQVLSNGSAGSDNSPRAFALEPSVNAEMLGEIFNDVDGRPVAFTRSRGASLSSPVARNFTIQRNNTANVTSLEIVAGSGTPFDIGSEFAVYRWA